MRDAFNVLFTVFKKYIVLICTRFIDHSLSISEPLRPHNQIKPVVINELQFRGMTSISITVCMPAFPLNRYVGSISNLLNILFVANAIKFNKIVKIDFN